ncbi:glycosyltransferase family 4 protein [Psychroflexus sp. MBR-150]|jgi:glycosyltransferase involved in cell wall biosynthesis
MIIGYEAKRYFHNSTGLGNYARSLVNNLAKFYPYNKYLLYNPKFNDTFKIPKQFHNKSIFEITPENRFNKKMSSLWRLKTVSTRFKNDNVNIFHGLSGELPMSIPKSISTVLTIHDLIFIRFPELYNFIDRKIYYHKHKKAAENADVIVAISQQTKQDIIHYLDMPPSKIKVIYQGCRDVFKKNYSDIEKVNVQKQFNLPKNYVLYVGTIEERKNLLNLVKAIKDVDINLVVVGKKTKYAEAVNSYIKGNNLQSKVHFLNNVDDISLAIIYQLAKVFVLPSFFEGFGIPIIEALYSKTPVITSKGSCFEEAGGSHSIYINPNNSSEIKNSLIKVLSDNSLQQQMTVEGVNHSKNFDDDNLAHQWIDLYSSLLS